MPDIHETNSLTVDRLLTLIADCEQVQEENPNPYIVNSYKILKGNLTTMLNEFQKYMDQIPLMELICDLYYIKDLSIEQISKELHFPIDKLRDVFKHCILADIPTIH